ncbi:MAG: 3-dehydroquinate synthase [Symbiobacteriia bacterium]
MKLLLVGMMGAGKSTVGRLLASEMGLPFMDSDDLIEARTGKTVAQIFAAEGEGAFRAYESQVAEELASWDHAVIATGGGTLLLPANREKLRSDSFWVYLKASPGTIWQRLSQSGGTSGEKRPLLAASDPMATLHKLLAEREPIYAQADLIVPTDEQSASTTVQDILAHLPAGVVHGSQAPDRPGLIEQIPVRLGARSYLVHVGTPLLSQAGALVQSVLPPPRQGRGQAIVIGQSLPGRLYAPALIDSLQKAGYQVHSLTIPDGESAKSLAGASQLYDQLAELQADRSSLLFALGGGVTGDLVGYVAATFMRGLPFIQVPTTLLAQVDASVGGKVAVNHPAGKNLIGAFHQPRSVLIDTATLASLPAGEFANGMAEVIKYALLAGESDVKQLERSREAILRRDGVALRSMVSRCCRAKARVVEADETDQGLRLTLNLGHTFGHALEALGGYSGYKHGEAVAIGCCLAAELSCRLGLLPAEAVRRTEELFRSYSLPTRAEGFDPEAVLVYFRHDKKAAAGLVRFVLMQGFGDITIRDDVPANLVLALLQEKVS